ncbi:MULTISPECIES: aldehyde dehydrogenase [unclassified Undibacterium]|uniref:aldehyde dehydrogenase n=1 Tax=unclassified Undibacterium TaxID=2630295 RepID=UPI002AC920C4|nr:MULTISPECIES: aldehyde dehydrogenase [unclassified Undibacterium]MEB0140543.1 aldehyde dehydrogenase family protein [Undibacterium sp. CCC2.1]MEB0171789.1 aldehyde dehydrogenase family protein [Undibacterium sp. CCC1.1]MEB0175605.1 aldehyde dehydrogenase family protein [Undibacterium sp. CCC3.4]MEB0216713.1 aldehyde dehydrogenase family protein [Undibacterium sp. 5I2]WPX44080.1 aldehyde dehydrogenase family protein [Undibacterium sp. CCC3.4]
MIYAAPGAAGAKVQFKSKYDNFIGGKWVAPVKGVYFDVVTPITGLVFTQAARSGAEDIELALDAAHAAADKWGRTSAAERSNILLKIADRLEANLELLAYAETIDNGKPIRETLNADIPLTIDHFRYFAGCVRAQEGGLSDLDENTVAYHFHEPLGVVGQIIPWNFPILMAAWKLAPAIGAGNCVVLKPAESTPISILIMAELIADLLPPGVLNIVNGYGREAGMPLATSRRIAKIAFTGSTSTGRMIAQAAANNLIPATLELGGKSPNVFFADVAQKDDAFFDKAIEGLVLFAFNQGEVCTSPSRALIHESIYDEFMERALPRVRAIKQGNPLDTDTMLGAQASKEQMTKIMSYLDLGLQEGAELLVGGARAQMSGELEQGYYIQPTMFKGHNKMRIFQEEIFGPVLAVTTFKDEADALAIANDTPYGLGAGVWSRDGNVAYRMGRGIKAGRVWTNCYHAYPAHATFGGYKESGIGRETHKMMLDHYQQTKNLLVSYSENKLGFF